MPDKTEIDVPQCLLDLLDHLRWVTLKDITGKELKDLDNTYTYTELK